MSFGLRELTLVGLLFGAGIYQCWQFEPGERRVSGDDKLYYFIAERAASGTPPHLSLVDHKHQLASLLEAAAISAGRRWGGDDLLSARHLSVAVAAATVTLVALLALALTGSRATAWLAGLVALTFSYFFQEGAIGFRPQLFMTFFMTAGLLAFVNERFLLAGAMSAAAFSCWQPSGLVGVAMAVALLTDARWRGRIVSLGGGAAAVIFAYEAYFWWHGALGEQLYQSYVMPATASLGPAMRPLAETLGMVANPLRGGRHRPEMIAGALLLTALGIGWSAALLRRGRARELWMRFPRWRVVWLAATAAVVYTFVDYQAYPDRFFLKPYYALALSVPLGSLVARFDRRATRAAAMAVAATVLAVTAQAMVPKRMSGDVDDQRRLAEVVRTMRESHGSVWVVGHTELLAFARLENHTPFGMLRGRGVYAYATSSTSNGAVYRPLRDGHMPELILMSRFGARRRLPWLRREYERVKTGPLAAARIGVYRRTAVTPAVEPPRRCGELVAGRLGEAIRDTLPDRPTMSDVLLIFAAVLHRQPCEACLCDIDGSSVVDITDAYALMHHVAGEPTPLDCPPCAPN